VPATMEVSAITAVDHSKVLTRRRRSAIKLGQLSVQGAGKYPGRGSAPVQAENPHGYDATGRCCRAPLTTRAGATNLQYMGMESPETAFTG
jgi:hypothetical protein